jgi:hypothetical protein
LPPGRRTSIQLTEPETASFNTYDGRCPTRDGDGEGDGVGLALGVGLTVGTAPGLGVALPGRISGIP